MNEGLQKYLQWRCRVNWHPKYYKYIDTWVANVTPNQCHYFEREMNNLINRGIYYL